jgi:hypothetical protein
MKIFAFTLLLSVFALGAMTAPAPAQDKATCEAQAVTKTTGKPLIGKAKISAVHRCMRDLCEPQAVDKNGKKLAGAQKNSFMRKCEKGA